MILVYRTLLNLLVAVSLIAAPVTASLAMVETTAEQPGHSLEMEPCHHAEQAQAATDTRHMAHMSSDGSCCDGCDDCHGHAGCKSDVVSSTTAMPAGFTAFSPVTSDSFTTAPQDSFSSLSPGLDSPPPIL